jgi:hypothetical protein
MRVKQECFKTIKDFHNNPIYRKGNGKPGVYLWGFSLEQEDFTIPSEVDMFFPYYVGKTEGDKGCMYQRAHEHITNLCGGNYSVFDILSCASAGTLIGNVHASYQSVSKKMKPLIGPTLPNPSYINLLHFAEGVHRHYQFFNDESIKKQIEWMVKHFCITFFTPENFNKQDIVDLEKYIGNIVGYDKLITKRYSKPDMNVEIIGSCKNIQVLSYPDLFKNCMG